MSRIGKKPVVIPPGVKAELKGSSLSVTGPKGTLQIEMHPKVKVVMAENEITVDIADKESKKEKSLWGLSRALINNLGLSVSLDAQGVRVIFPELTSERRILLTKLVKEKLEEARIKMRTEREKSLDDLDGKEKDGSLSKDDKFRLKNELQKLVDDTNRELEALALKKEKEILE